MTLPEYRMHHDEDLPRRKYLRGLIRKYQQNNNSILDVAVGANPLISQTYFKNKYAVELLPEMVELQKSTGVRCYQYDVNKGLPAVIKRNKYDVILCTEILEHLVDARKLLSDIKSCMHNKSILILSVPNELEFYGNRLTLFARGDITHMRTGFYEMQHVRFFTATHLKEVLKLAGFDILEFTGINFTVRNSLRGYLISPPFKEWLASKCPRCFATNYVCVAMRRN